MPYALRMNVRPTSAKFFSSWNDDERLFLCNLFKRYACSKVHLMEKIKASPYRRSDCGGWRIWTIMASKLRDVLGKNVEPRTLETFFWYVIAQRADKRSYNSWLDLLILRSGSLSSAVDTDDSDDAVSSDDERIYSGYNPSQHGSSTDSAESTAVDGDTVWAQPLETQESGSTDSGSAPAPRSRTDYAGGTMPQTLRWRPRLVLCKLHRGCLVPAVSFDRVGERRDPLSVAPLPEDRERHHAVRNSALPAATAQPVEQRFADSVDGVAPVQERNPVPVVCNEAHLLDTAVVEHRLEDSEVCIENDDGNGSAESFAPPASAYDEISDGDCLERSCSATLSSPYEGHHCDNDSKAAADDALSLVGRGNKEVQCDLYLTCWRDLLMTGMILQAEAVRRFEAFRDRLLALRDA